MSDAQKIRKFNRALMRERRRERGPKPPIFIIFLLLFTALVVIRQGLTYRVEYQTMQILSVTQITGESLSSRLVRINVEGGPRTVRTSDPLIVTQPGQQVCVAKRQIIGRSRIRYRLALPFYCRPPT